MEDGSVDVMISNGVINLCPDKRAVFAEIRRILRPGEWLPGLQSATDLRRRHSRRCTVISRAVMVYRVLADAVVLVHLAFILFVAVGALLAWRWPRMVWAHLPALAWGVGTVTIGFPCPLTTLEKALDRRAGGDVYDGGFIDRYVEDVIYPDEYSSILRSLAAVVIVIGYLGLRHRRHLGAHGVPA